MSFPRASIKRFNDNNGCAPPPGAYDPKSLEKAHGGIVDKSERFKVPKEPAPCSSVANVSTASSSSTNSTPVKKSLFPGSQSNKKRPPVPTIDPAQVKELEKEIRRLAKERADKDKLLSCKEEELKKLDGRLHNAVSEKNGLQARLASADKELSAARKANDLLKNKLSSNETNQKKYEEAHSEVTSLQHQISQKDGEISRLSDSIVQVTAALVAQMAWLETHVEKLETTVHSYKCLLGERMEDRSHNKAKKSDEDVVNKLKDEKFPLDQKLKLIKKKSDSLHARVQSSLSDLDHCSDSMKSRYDSLVTENARLQGEVTAVKSQLEEAVTARSALEDHRDNLLDSKTSLEDQVKLMSAEKSNTLDQLRMLTERFEELQVSNLGIQQQLDDAQSLHETTCQENSRLAKCLEERELIAGETTASMHERICALQAQNEDLAATLSETGELLSRTKEENARLEALLKNSEQMWGAEKQDLVTEKSRVENELNDCEGRVRRLESEIAEQKEKSQETVQLLSGQLEGEKAELVQLQNKLGDLVYEKSQLHMQIGHLEAQMKVVKCESDDMKNEADGLIAKLRGKLEKLDSEKVEIEQLVKDLSTENETLQVTLERSQADFDAAGQKVAEERQTAQEKIAELAQEVEDAREKMSQQTEERFLEKSELDVEVAKLECRVRVLEMEAEQVRQEMCEERNQLQSELEAITRHKEQIERDSEQYGLDLISNAAQLQTLQALINRKTSECEILLEDKERLNNDLKQLTEQHDLTVSELQKMSTDYSSKRRECDSLLEENDRLKDDLKEMTEKYEDQECMLQQIRVDFKKRCSERDELQQQLEEKTAAVDTTSQQLQQVQQALEAAQTTIDKHTKELTTADQRAANFKQQMEDYKEHLQTKCEECDDLQHKIDELDSELTLSAREMLDIQERAEALKKYNSFLYRKLVSVTYAGNQLIDFTLDDYGESDAEKTELIQDYEAQLAEVRDTASQAGSADLQEELDRYKQMYEELEAKVGPFMEQLDAYKLEKELLMGVNKDTQAEMERLGVNYAKLLGHQNQKQKIKHIEKMKEENYSLKRENQTLREQVTKQKRQLLKAEAPRKFDPSKAFTTNKENVSTPASKQLDRESLAPQPKPFLKEKNTK